MEGVSPEFKSIFLRNVMYILFRDQKCCAAAQPGSFLVMFL